MATPSTLSLLTQRIGALPVPPHDYQTFTYSAAGVANDDLLTVITYKRGGAGGTTVATVTIAYVGATNNITSMTLAVP